MWRVPLPPSANAQIPPPTSLMWIPQPKVTHPSFSRVSTLLTLLIATHAAHSTLLTLLSLSILPRLLILLPYQATMGSLPSSVTYEPCPSLRHTSHHRQSTCSSDSWCVFCVSFVSIVLPLFLNQSPCPSTHTNTDAHAHTGAPAEEHAARRGLRESLPPGLRTCLSHCITQSIDSITSIMQH
jgi:hypothetical protein